MNLKPTCHHRQRPALKVGSFLQACTANSGACSRPQSLTMKRDYVLHIQANTTDGRKHLERLKFTQRTDSMLDRSKRSKSGNYYE